MEAERDARLARRGLFTFAQGERRGARPRQTRMEREIKLQFCHSIKILKLLFTLI